MGDFPPTSKSFKQTNNHYHGVDELLLYRRHLKFKYDVTYSKWMDINFDYLNYHDIP